MFQIAFDGYFEPLSTNSLNFDSLFESNQEFSWQYMTSQNKLCFHTIGFQITVSSCISSTAGSFIIIFVIVCSKPANRALICSRINMLIRYLSWETSTNFSFTTASEQEVDLHLSKREQYIKLILFYNASIT